jgi:hypothetical protein
MIEAESAEATRRLLTTWDDHLRLRFPSLFFLSLLVLFFL